MGARGAQSRRQGTGVVHRGWTTPVAPQSPRSRRPTGLAEPQVQRRSDEQVQQGGGDQAAEDHHRERVFDLMARPFAQHHQRNQGQAGGERGHQDRREALASCPHHQVLAERLTLLPLEVLGVVDQQDAVAGRDAEDGEEADQGPERDHSAPEERGKNSAHQGHREGQEDQQRRAPAAERGLQQEHDGDGGQHCGGEQLSLRGLPLGVLAEDLQVVTPVELDIAELLCSS